MPKSKNPIGYYKSKRLVSKDGRIVGVEDILVHPSDGKVVVISKEVAEEMDRKKEGKWATEYLYRMHHKNELGNLKRRGLQGNTAQEAYDKILAEHPEYKKEWDEAGITRENEHWGLDDQYTEDRRLYFVRRPNIPYVGHLKLRVKKDVADEYLDAYLEEDKGLPKEYFYDSGRVIPPEHIQVRSGKKWVPVTEYEYQERKKKGTWAGKKPWEMTKEEYIKYRNPSGERIADGVRPRLSVGDLEGMDIGSQYSSAKLSSGELLKLYKNKGRDVYGVIGKDIVGFSTALDDKSIDLTVVNEHQRKGIGTILSQEYKKFNPKQPAGGLTVAGYATMGKEHKLEVANALNKGKSVPDSVLKDYADLYQGKKGTWAVKYAPTPIYDQQAKKVEHLQVLVGEYGICPKRSKFKKNVSKVSRIR